MNCFPVETQDPKDYGEIPNDVLLPYKRCYKHQGLLNATL